jgi:alanine racemase
MPSPRPTIAEVNLDAFQHNLEQVQGLVGPEREIFAVIKANAYGHGAVEIGRVLERAGVRFVGVATVEEGIELRQAGLKTSITILGGLFPEQYDLLLEHGLTPALYNLEWAEALSSLVGNGGEKIPVQVKVDTGMGRLGIMYNEALKVIEQINSLPGLELMGIFSHFAFADLDDRSFVQGQLDCLLNLKKALSEKNVHVPFWHLSNSGGVITFPASFFNMVRPGIMLYGYPPSPVLAGETGIKPVLSWRTRIIHLKEVPPGTPLSYDHTFRTTCKSIIATLPVGYADGYSRRLSNRAEVLVRGRRAPVVGRVTMDMILADVTDIDQASMGDRVTLLGEDGGDRITAQDIADWSETITYEVLCGISPRVPRVYIEKETRQADC